MQFPTVAPQYLAELDKVRQLAKDLNYHYQDSVRIAGGAVRNPLTNRYIKDIDIFVNNEALIHRIAGHLNLDIQREPLACAANGSPYEDVHFDISKMKVWKCDDLMRHGLFCPVDLIWVPSISGRIEEFPDYISQMWLDGYGAAQWSLAAEEDASRQRIRYSGKAMREKRLARFKELYADWEFIDLDTDLEITFHEPSKQARRREGRPDYAPLWWDLDLKDKQLPDRAWDAMHDLCKAQKGASLW